MTNELKPCPFCGSDNLKHSNNKPSFWHHWVQCNDCLASSDAKGGTANAIDKWNRRATPPVEPAGVTEDALLQEAIAEGCEDVAGYVQALKQSSATYFAERNSARDAYRRHRDESEARGKLINIVLGMLDAPPGANVVQAVAAAIDAARAQEGEKP